MTLENQFKLSFYQECAKIGNRENVHLVQHTESRKFYVRKDLKIYNKSVYDVMRGITSEFFPEIVECIEEGDELIVIEEYIHGDSLDTIYREKGVLSEEAMVNYAVQLCEALKILHSLHPPIIHRDIKPSNVIITNDGRLKLIDINIAKTFEESSTKDTVLIGTREFAAPEQYGFRQSDARTDIYGIGVMMNYLLSGKFPREYMYQGPLADMIKKCVQLDPDHRFKNVEELEQQLLKTKMIKQDYIKATTNESNWKKFLLPGFRTGRIWKMVIAALGYASLISICVDSEFNEQGVPITGARLVYDRVWMFVIFFAGLLILANYLNVQKKLPMFQRDHRVMRSLQVVLYSMGIMFLSVCFMIVLESIIW